MEVRPGEVNPMLYSWRLYSTYTCQSIQQSYFVGRIRTYSYPVRWPIDRKLGCPEKLTGTDNS